MGILLAFFAGWATCARAGTESHDEVIGALKAVRDSDEVADLLTAMRSHAGFAFKEFGSRLLDAGETAERLRIAGTLGSIHHPHCARINPARLVRGLADAVERLGVPILEGTTVTEIRPGAAVTSHTRCPASRCACARARVPGQIRSAMYSS